MSRYRRHRVRSLRGGPSHYKCMSETFVYKSVSCFYVWMFQHWSDVFELWIFFFYMLILYQLYWCDIVTGVCIPVFVCMLFYVFHFFLLSFLFNPFNSTHYNFSTRHCLRKISAFNSGRSLHSKVLRLWGWNVFMCLVCCDLNWL